MTKLEHSILIALNHFVGYHISLIRTVIQRNSIPHNKSARLYKALPNRDDFFALLWHGPPPSVSTRRPDEETHAKLTTDWPHHRPTARYQSTLKTCKDKIASCGFGASKMTTFIRQKLRPKHQVLILKCYPQTTKGAVDVKPNSSELSYLLYYATTRRSKVQKVGAFLEKKTESDVYKARIGYVCKFHGLVVAWTSFRHTGKSLNSVQKCSGHSTNTSCSNRQGTS